MAGVGWVGWFLNHKLLKPAWCESLKASLTSTSQLSPGVHNFAFLKTPALGCHNFIG